MPSSTLPMTGSDIEDFDSIPALLDPPDTAAYILVKLDSSSNDDSGREWVLATYVPDRAAVRSKMLYSSTKASLVRQLGEGRFKHTIFASSPEELSREGYKRFIKHHESSAPMTAREQEMDDIKKAEGTEVLGGSARRSHAGSSLGMEWDEDVEQAFEELAKGEKRIVQLVRARQGCLRKGTSGLLMSNIIVWSRLSIHRRSESCSSARRTRSRYLQTTRAIRFTSTQQATVRPSANTHNIRYRG